MLSEDILDVPDKACSTACQKTSESNRQWGESQGDGHRILPLTWGHVINHNEYSGEAD